MSDGSDPMQQFYAKKPSRKPSRPATSTRYSAQPTSGESDDYSILYAVAVWFGLNLLTVGIGLVQAYRWAFSCNDLVPFAKDSCQQDVFYGGPWFTQPGPVVVAFVLTNTVGLLVLRAVGKEATAKRTS